MLPIKNNRDLCCYEVLEPPSPKRARTSSEEGSTTKWIEDWQEFNRDFIEPIKQSSSLQKTITFIKNYFTSDEIGRYSLYVQSDTFTLKPVCLKVTYYSKPFRSHALSEDLFLQKGEIKGESHHYIKVFENVSTNEENEDVRVLKLRFSPSGKLAELMWICKGVNVSGNDLIKISTLFEEIFKVEKVFLYDDSNLHIAHKKKSYKLSLRYLTTFSHDNALSWYEQKNFKVYNNKNFVTFPTLVVLENGEEKTNTVEQKLSQSSIAYANAKKVIYNTTFKELLSYYRGYPKSREIITKLQKYFKDKQSITIHEAVKKIVEISKKLEGYQAYKLQKLLDNFFKNCLLPWRSPHEVEMNLFTFQSALEVFQMTPVFVKEKS